MSSHTIMDPSKKTYTYNQLSHIEDQHYPKPKTKPIIITITVTITTSLILLSLFSLLYPSSQTPPITTHPELDSNSSIRLVCNVTRHPDTCFSTLSSLNTRSDPDPEFLFSLSLHSAILSLNSLRDSLSQLRVNDSRTRSALEDCGALLGDAVDRVKSTVDAVKGHVATARGVKISDVNTWISGAMTCQETCFDGLEEIGSTVLDDVRVRAQGSKVCLSDSLAILGSIKSLVERFHLPVSGGQ